MANLQGFDANTVEPSVGYDPLPAGKYLAAIVASEVKPAKAQGATYLELAFEILEGEYKGRKTWARLNLVHPNAKVVQIARAELSAICRAVGVMAPKDSYELHNLPLVITVKCKPRKDTGDIGNEIKGYAKRGAQAPAPAAGNSSPPWRR